VVFSKLVLVGRLENLVNDRRLVEPCALWLDILLFLGYGVARNCPGIRPSAVPASFFQWPSSNAYLTASLPSP
jgi:hypothetical protein